jgi:bifunctional non-homologous end joining protein LigD
MLATTAAAPLDAADLAYEPKYDGIRAIASIGPDVRLWSRSGNEKTSQFPEISTALAQWGRYSGHPVILDGEIVALDAHGAPTGFQNLQGRIHLKDVGRAFQARQANPQRSPHCTIAYIVFDVLRDGDEDLRPLPLRERRSRLERLLKGVADPRLRISEQVVGAGAAMHARAQAEQWEGLIAKRLDAPYKSGRRSPNWRKLKLVRRQACVIGGWTDPRGSRPFFGALLLGVYDDAGRLQYIGHSGAGFTDAELGLVRKKLQALQSKLSPFAVIPRTNERPHWVRPTLVAEVKFTEWTADRRLRHPTYIGLRDDIDPAAVRREPDTVIGVSRRGGTPAAPEGAALRPAMPVRGSAAPSASVVEADLQVRLSSAPRPDRAAERAPKAAPTGAAMRKLLEQIDAIDERGGGGTLVLPSGDRLEVSNLGKMFWPKLKLTKGDLLRHYIRVSPHILPVLADRPLVMKRYPNGVAGKPFYQHRAPDKLPAGVRVEQASTETETRPHLIGGSLTTLLYTAQLASISQDPWFSRIQAEDIVDHVAIDLDPPDGLPFKCVLDVARWVRDELESLKATGFAKTSGSGGLHIYVPMPAGTAYAAGLLFCQIVATVVARKHPNAATVERAIKARGKRVYVDYLQNIRGKTLASAYSLRANEFAGVSAPLTWKEVDAGKVRPQDFTILTMPERLSAAGDLWAPLRKAKGADLRAVMQYAEPASARRR